MSIEEAVEEIMKKPFEDATEDGELTIPFGRGLLGEKVKNEK